ncbi:hypothetical protein [uncultured Pelagimonas sp.]|uniref:hypothetical protein n=1 Tax=uncultured Pelagimonas sp. TaxID=1618102 RepID=UPI0026221201|nr:hypothetical protein [uncultured Pelagimonas sp.]
MLAAALLGLLSIGLLATLIDSGSDSDDSSDDVAEPDFAFDEEGNLVGTEGADTFTADDNVEFGPPDSLLMGAGDDVVDLRVSSEWLEANPDVPVGEAAPVPTLVDLGAGDDTLLTQPGWVDTGGQVLGGEGDDSIVAQSAFEADIQGGAGNDTIDVRGAASTTVQGGEGDDYIYTPGMQVNGTGFTTNTFGEAGDDTLHVVAESEFEFANPLMGANITGGEGTDHFIVELNEGRELTDEAAENPNDLGVFLAGFDELENEDGTALRVTALSLADFDPQTETLQLNLTPVSDQFEVGSVHMEEDGIVVTYTPLEYEEHLLPREILIDLETEGLTWDQVTLIGAERALLLDLEGNLVGTDGDDTLTRSELEAFVTAEVVSLGAGNDLIDTTSPEGEPNVGISAEFEIDLGDGDDTLLGPFFGSTILGGDGEDLIDAEEAHGEVLSIDGGEGNDTIDVNLSPNVFVDGGAGDDEILGIGRGFLGTGYATGVTGGDGDDTLSVEALTEFGEGLTLTDAWTVEGGEGSDHFVVQLDEGELEVDGSGWDNLETTDGTAWQVEAARFDDFDPVTETIELRVESVNDEYALGSVRMTDDGIVVRYENTLGDQLDREVLIRVETEGLTWDQVTLIGAERSVLEPIAA